MTHRFVAVVATALDGPRYENLRAAAGHRLSGWGLAHSSALAEVRVTADGPSQFGFRALGDRGCVIGLDFPGGAHHASANGPERMLEATWGAYIAMFVDRGARRVTVLRDPTGRIECWRLQLNGADLLFSHLDDVRAFASAPVAINWDFIAYHLTLPYLQGDQTGLADVTEVLPGEALVYADGRATKHLAWQPHRIAGEPHRRLEVAREAIRGAAEVSAATWSRVYKTIALDLSGGLDSSIVLGLLRACAQHQRVVGVNYVTAHAEGDERAYARDAAHRHSVDLLERQLRFEALGEADLFAGRALRPTSRMMPLGFDPLHSEILRELEADGYFTGSGGDHLFFDGLTGGCAVDYLYGGGTWRGFLAVAHQLANLSKDTIWNVIGEALPTPRGHNRIAPILHRDTSFLCHTEMTFATLERFIHPWLRDVPATTAPGKLHQIHNLAELYRHYWRYGRADVAEEIHPLISQPLMEACLRTPTYWFGVGGVQRGLARRAFSDLLPASVLYRRGKSANTSHWVEAFVGNLPKVRRLLLDGVLAARGLVDRPRLEAALNPLALSAARQRACLVTCLTTEMWLQAMTSSLA